MAERTLTEAEFNALKAKVLSSAPEGLKEADFGRYIGPAMAQAVGEAENSSAPVEGSAIERFAAGAWRNLNPAGLVEAVSHPVDAVKGLIDAHTAQLEKAKAAFGQGRYSEAAGHLAASALPVIGPAAANAGETIASGDVAGGLGEGAALVAPIAGKAARGPIGRTVSAVGRGVETVGASGAARTAAAVGAPMAAYQHAYGTAGAIAAAPYAAEVGGRVLQFAGDRIAGAPTSAAAPTGPLPQVPAGSLTPEQLAARVGAVDAGAAVTPAEVRQRAVAGARLQAQRAAAAAKGQPVTEVPPAAPIAAPAPASPAVAAPSGGFRTEKGSSGTNVYNASNRYIGTFDTPAKAEQWIAEQSAPAVSAVPASPTASNQAFRVEKGSTGYNVYNGSNRYIGTFDTPEKAQGWISEQSTPSGSPVVPPTSGTPPAASALPNQKALNGLAIAAKRARIVLTPVEEQALVPLVEQGATPEQAVGALVAQRTAANPAAAFNERFGLKTPTDAETKFPKGMRGKASGASGVSAARLRELQQHFGGTQP